MLIETTSSQRQKLMQEYCARLLAENRKCEKCGREVLLTIDHIIPISILYDLGIDSKTTVDFENLRVLCKPCNMLKSSHLDFSTPKTKILLLRYIKRLEEKPKIAVEKLYPH